MDFVEIRMKVAVELTQTISIEEYIVNREVKLKVN